MKTLEQLTIQGELPSRQGSGISDDHAGQVAGTAHLPQARLRRNDRSGSHYMEKS